jgi:hypothetical protein
MGTWQRAADRLLGPSLPPSGAGAGVQLWWQVPRGLVVVGVSAVLEVLQPPVSGRRYRWGLQAGLASSDHVGPAAVFVEGSDRLVLRAADHGAASLTDPAVSVELEGPPDDPTVVARWSALSLSLADGSTMPVEAVMVTFPTGRRWRRLDVVVDDVGVLQVSNTRRTVRNMSVLALPGGR